MSSLVIDDVRVTNLRPLEPPNALLNDISLSEDNVRFINKTRKAIENILSGHDNRLLVVVGPCSIHDPLSAIEYAHQLKMTADRLRDDLLIVMRVYFEKPRTIIGWKGFINDPMLNGSFNINQGLRLARSLLKQIVELELPAATEFLDNIIPQYISDVISWGAIGARTTESQLHRELASGLSMPIGFKNGTDGNIKIAVDAMRSAQKPHTFLSIDKQGSPVIVSTQGNNKTHIILRGSHTHTNYEQKQVQQAVHLLKDHNLQPSVMVDCSHGNSQKLHQQQIYVCQNLAHQISEGSQSINGIMLESHLKEGNQAFNKLEHLDYGKSITDACISWKQTQPLLEALALSVKKRNKVSLCQVMI